MRWFSILFALFLSSQAMANPWLHAEGTGFTSVEDTARFATDGSLQKRYSSVFFEYGLSAETTLGLKAGIDETQKIDALVTIKRRLLEHDSGLRMAYSLGLGMTHSNGTSDPFVQLGLSLGRGLTFGAQTGWVSIAAQHDFDRFGGASKIEGTLGLNTAKDWKYILQVSVEKVGAGDWQSRLSPSVVIPVHENSYLQLGLYAESQASDDIGIKVGLWREF